MEDLSCEDVMPLVNKSAVLSCVGQKCQEFVHDLAIWPEVGSHRAVDWSKCSGHKVA